MHEVLYSFSVSASWNFRSFIFFSSSTVGCTQRVEVVPLVISEKVRPYPHSQQRLHQELVISRYVMTFSIHSMLNTPSVKYARDMTEKLTHISLSTPASMACWCLDSLARGYLCPRLCHQGLVWRLLQYISISYCQIRIDSPIAHGIPTKRLMALWPEEPVGAPYSESVEVTVSLLPSLFSISNLCWRNWKY